MDEPEPTKETSKKIQAINKEAVHKICSGQVVLDLAVAVKELVENSIDSGATSVEVKLTDFGQTCITVSDNGCGVKEDDFEELCLKHHTSKLREFSDLTEVETFGFRGEALSSLCALSELIVTTRHSSSPYGFKLEFDKNGVLQKKDVTAREKGTTVVVRNIFKTLPVRAKEFQKNIKKEYAKAIQILQGYCLVSTGVKISCTNSTGNKNQSVVVSTTGSSLILENVVSIFGSKAKVGLMQIEALSPDAETLEEFSLKPVEKIDFTWDFFVSGIDHASGRSSPDRQFFYINGRPCDLTKVNKIINQVYHKYNMKQYPFVYLNLKLSQQSADVNVTPDKRTILMIQEKLVLATIKYSLTKAWESTQGKFTVRSLEEFNFNVNKKRSNPAGSPENEPKAKRRSVLAANESILESIKRGVSDRRTRSNKNKDDEEEIFFRVKKEVQSEEEDEEIARGEKPQKSSKIKVETEDICEEKVLNTTHKLISLERAERLPDVTMKISLEEIRSKLKNSKISKDEPKQKEMRVKYRMQLDAKGSDAEKELERELSKESFNEMSIIGQFNLGFIIARLQNDLFIIDQHATDEKYRFEKLSKETKLNTQRLIIPKPLALSALNETILLEHQSIFEDNGFTFKVNPDGEPGKSVELTGMPVSGGWKFGQEDIEELIFLIHEGGTQYASTIPRPSKVRQMFASRACRSAVMIGSALNPTEMRRLVSHMALMDQPWNCPHGRPTIRHLLSLTLLNK